MPPDQFASVRALAENRLVPNVEMGIVKDDGKTTWITVTAAPIPLPAAGVVVAYNDITDRKEAQERVQASERRYRILASSAPIGIFQSDRAGARVYANDRWREILGATDDDVRNPDWNPTFHPDDDETMRLWHEAVGAGTEFRREYRMVVRDRETIWISAGASPIHDESGTFLGHIGTIEDITDRRLASYVLGRRLELEKAITSVSSRFVGTFDMDTAVAESLGEIGRLTLVSRCDVCLLEPDGKYMVNRDEWLADDAPVPSDGRSRQATDAFPWWMGTLGDGRVVRTDDVAAMPPEASASTERLASRGMRAALALPLRVGSGLGGFLGLEGGRQYCNWAEDDIAQLQVVAEIIGNAFQRQNAEREVQRYADAQAVLLREVDHRVKNNLTAIIGMLYAEQDRATRQGITNYGPFMSELVGRVRGLSTVHTMLSASAWRPLDLRELCMRVVDSALNSLSTLEGIAVSVAPSDIRVGSGQAHHLALVLNELATNSLRHGLGTSERGGLTSIYRARATWPASSTVTTDADSPTRRSTETRVRPVEGSTCCEASSRAAWEVAWASRTTVAQ